LKLFRRTAILLSALAAAFLARAASAPSVTFELDPPNPVAGQAVRLRDTSAAAASSWFWDFGDSGSSNAASPSHAWSEPGDYAVKLLAQGSTAEATVTVSPSTTLRLLSAHPFEIAVDAVDPASGDPSPAQAIAISDRFGWFSFPGLTHDPGNPEVTVKVLEAPSFGHYWIFWSAMTSLEYTMTVRDVATGHVEVYKKEGPSPCGGWDTQSFEFVPTPTPPAPGASPTPATPTVTNAPNATPTRTRTRTPSPTITVTPTSTPSPTITATPTITPTPTPAPPALIHLRARQWQWDFFSTDLGINGGNSITLRVGQTYQVDVYNGDTPDVTEVHTLQSIGGIGLQGGSLPQGSSLPLQTIQPMNTGDFAFNCTSYCGQFHDDMLGTVHVVP